MSLIDTLSFRVGPIREPLTSSHLLMRTESSNITYYFFMNVHEKSFNKQNT